MTLDSSPIDGLAGDLLQWYSQNKRDLPWRREAKAYEVWLAEIVFQQTRIDQGMSYYRRLLDRFPDVRTLAEADEDEVLKHWEGLGYYSRARNLHASAKHIMDEFGGEFPSDHSSILSLKGVGSYTAAAIASVAFSLPYPAIDGNVLRVSSRLFNIEDPIDLGSTQKEINKILSSIMPENAPGDFNQAMMELGALICSPRSPKCNECPLEVHCTAKRLERQESLPVKRNKTKVRSLFFNYVLLESDEVYIHQRSEGIWNKLYQFPLIESEKDLSEEEFVSRFLKDEVGIRLRVSPSYKHQLSHRKIEVKFWMLNKKKDSIFSSSFAVKKDQLSSYAMPRIITRFLESDEAKEYGLV